MPRGLDIGNEAYNIPGVNHSRRHTVAPAPTTRKARFLAALRIAGTTMDAWATDHQTSQGYVSNLLSGKRTNPELVKKIDAFAEKHLKAVA